MRYPQFPRLQGINPVVQRQLEETWAALISELEARDRATIFGAANADPYIVTNTSVQRTMNVAAIVTVSQLAPILGTLISDLKAHGNLG